MHGIKTQELYKSYSEISINIELALRPVPGIWVKVNQYMVQNYDQYGQCNQKFILEAFTSCKIGVSKWFGMI